MAIFTNYEKSILRKFQILFPVKTKNEKFVISKMESLCLIVNHYYDWSTKVKYCKFSKLVFQYLNI